MASQPACSVIPKKLDAFRQGVTELEKVQQDLNANVASATAWGVTAVMANLTIVPLNIIVNALPVPKTKSIYQRLATAFYNKYGKSGTRNEGGNAKKASDALGTLRDTINTELKKEKLAEYIPGVNIIVGAVQDSLAAWQTVETFANGQKDMTHLQRNAQANIAKMKKALADLQAVYDRDCSMPPMALS